MKIHATIEKDENGYFAYVPSLQGCVTQGETLEDTRENIKEAVALYLESLEADEIQSILSKQVTITPIEVALGWICLMFWSVQGFCKIPR